MNISFAVRIGAYFAGLFLLAIGSLMALWYFGLTPLGLVGASNQMQAEAIRHLEYTADYRHALVSSNIRERRSDILLIAEDTTISKPLEDENKIVHHEEKQGFDRLMRAYPDRYLRLMIVDPKDGRIRASSDDADLGLVFQDFDLISRARQPGITELVEQVVLPGGVPTLAIVRQIRALDADGHPGPKLVGILIALLDAQQLLGENVLSESPTARRNDTAMFFDSTGRFIARAQNSGTDSIEFKLNPQVAKNFEGTVLETDAKGQQLMVVYRHLQLSGTQGWRLVHYWSKDEALDVLRGQARILGFVGFLLTLVCLASIILVAHRLTRPLKSLMLVAQQLGSGDLSVRTRILPQESAELKALSRSFNTMADDIQQAHRVLETKVQQRTAELAQERDAAQRYLDIAGVTLIAVDKHGRISMINKKGSQLLGKPESELLGVDWIENCIPAEKRRVMRTVFAQLMTGETDLLDYYESQIINADGQKRLVACNSVLLCDERGAPNGILTSTEDITERKQAESKLQLAAGVFRHAREGIFITNAHGIIMDVNEAFTRITGYLREEAIGQNPRILSSGRQDRAFYAAMWGVLTQRGYWSGEIWNRRKNGEVYTETLTISAVPDATGETQHYVALFSDITAMKEHQSQLEHIAHFDALTDLPNRVLLADRLHQAMAQAQRRDQQLAVVYLDLDGFKAINDHHGHETGDQVLIALAIRMKQAVRESDTLARIGGDEFVAVLIDLEEPSASVTLLDRLLAAVALPVQVGDLSLQVSASLGVTFYPQAQDIDADQLMRQADQAMYQAKLAGKNRYYLFDAAQDSNIRVQHESLQRIRLALKNNEFVLHYQPKVNMQSGQVVGAEALIRWQHPEKGLLAPATFLPVIEDHSLAVDVGEWVIDTALTQVELWQAAGLNLPVSVNIGAYQLQQSDFVRRLQSILDKHPQVPAACIELEVLETSALADMEQVSKVIEYCNQIGVKFALDDFGTGYSSLTYLKRLRVALLKIDQSFVRDMLVDPDDLAILRGVIGLAAAFKREVIAEGVETVAHGTALLQLGCELAQGYGIARPMPPEKLPAWVATWQPDSAWRVVDADGRTFASARTGGGTGAVGK
ncbi:MAG: EAL domain-containing protein [Rhodoferax sp.]|nr:EAL domain-containing protein [Rhodoferax sp.]